MSIKYCTSLKEVCIPHTVIELFILSSSDALITIPNTITILHVCCTKLFDGKSIPSTVMVLTVKDCPLFDGQFISDSVEKLQVYHCSLFSGNKIPSQLKMLDVWDCPLFCPTSLPPTLNDLRVIACPLFTSVPYTCPNMTVIWLEFPFNLKEYLVKCDLQNVNYIREKRPKLLNDDCWSIISSFIIS
jgi:hypothetical protein